MAINGEYLGITDASADGNGLVTLTSNGNSNFAVGTLITVAGFTDPDGGYNGTWVVSSASGNQIQYTDTTTGLETLSDQTVPFVASALMGTQRSMVNSVVYQFDTPVYLDSSAITITLHSGVTVTLGNGTQTVSGGTVGTVPDDNTMFSPDGGYTWVINFGGAGVTGGGSIADGVYDITLDASHITTTSGGGVILTNYNGGTGSDTETFWCLFGDANANRKVTTQDYSQFAASYQATSNSPAYVAWFDQNGNDKVTTQDYALFADNYLEKYSGFTATI